jgi:predicted dehydrogenase
MDIVGTKRRIRLLDSGLAVESSEARPSAEFAGYQVLGAATTTRSGFDDPALRVIEDLVRVIESGGRPRCTLEDGARAVVVAEAIVTSALERRRVSVRVPS